MRVADEDEVDAALFEHGQEDLAHVVHPALAVGILVGVVRAFGVGRVVEKRDDPVALGGGEVGLEPLHHRAVGRAVRVVGIEVDEMDVG